MKNIFGAVTTEAKLNSLMSIIKRLNSSFDLGELFTVIMNEAKEVINSEGSSLLLIDKMTNELYFNVVTGSEGDVIKEIRVPMGMGIAGISAETGESIIVNDAENDSRIFKKVDQKSHITTRNLLCVPLVAKGNILGVLEVINKADGKDYDDNDLALLKTLADYAAIAVNNSDLYKELQRKAYESQALYELSQSYNESQNLNEMLGENIAVICEAMDASRVSIIIKNEESGEYKFKAGVGIEKEVLDNGKITIKDNVLSEVIKTGNAVFSADINADNRFPNNKSLRYDARSFVCAPLKNRDKIVGFVCATEKRGKTEYRASDASLLEMLAQQLYENYDHMLLMEQSREKEKIEAELSITAKMQQQILPVNFSNEHNLDISAVSRPAREVGGDFYDFIPLGNGKYVLLIADVSGKGMPAGLFMAISRSVIRVCFNESYSPAKVFEIANRHVYEDSKTGMFVTSFCCVVDTKKKKITYSNAGHFEQFFIRDENTKILTGLQSGNRPLGVIRDEKFNEKTISYKSSDALFMYTDGITEAINSREEQYGDDRLKTILEEKRNMSAADMIKQVIDHVALFTGDTEQFDDMTMMAVRF